MRLHVLFSVLVLVKYPEVKKDEQDNERGLPNEDRLSGNQPCGHKDGRSVEEHDQEAVHHGRKSL